MNSLSPSSNSSDLFSVTLVATQCSRVFLMYPFRTVCLFVCRCFVASLQARREASFYLCGEVSKFVHKLCARCYSSYTVPLENAWFMLLGFETTDGAYIDETQFLLRQKLTFKVITASKHKSVGQ